MAVRNMTSSGSLRAAASADVELGDTPILTAPSADVDREGASALGAEDEVGDPPFEFSDMVTGRYT